MKKKPKQIAKGVAQASPRQKILILVGPTASGKTALAVELARKYNGEVISADSRQVYRGLDIATGKVIKTEMRGITHHLLDVVSPQKSFSAQDFVDHAARAIKDIAKRGKLPIIAGGTGFYIDTLTGRINIPDVTPNATLRQKLETKTSTELMTLLKKRDPMRAEALSTPSERNNKVRLIRALEIASGRKKDTFPKELPSYETLWIGLMPPFSVLEEKIEKRVASRIRKGMIKEAQELHQKGLSYKRMRELGLEYRMLADHLEGKLSKAQLIQRITIENRRYAKRQLTYWKRNAEIEWFDPANQQGEIESRVSNWLFT